VTFAHFAATHIDTTASFAMAQLSDVASLGQWALGSMDFVATSDGNVWRGRSLFDGSDCFVEIRAYPDLGLVDYHVGSLQMRIPRVSIRIVPGDTLGSDDACCIATMTTWRADHVDDDGWIRTCRAHDLEVLLFKAQIETAWNATV
jgi:hypothetical protein